MITAKTKQRLKALQKAFQSISYPIIGKWAILAPEWEATSHLSPEF